MIRTVGGFQVLDSPVQFWLVPCRVPRTLQDLAGDQGLSVPARGNSWGRSGCSSYRGQAQGKLVMHAGIRGAATLGKILLERPKSEHIKSLSAGSNFGNKNNKIKIKKNTSGTS